jgi:glycolate oxidase FAD binding subunit
MTAADATLARLGAALGAEAIGPGGEVGLEGVRPAATLEPRDAAELARAVGALGACGLAALVRGGGTRLGLGNPPRRADAVLSTRRIAGVADFDPGEGVCLALAGTPLAELRAAVNAGGWELPLDPPGRGSTLGGALAAAAVGPRAQGFGLPRDLVLGMEVVLGDGSRTRCGGRVVKNVTGYDLAKLYTGSLGTLGVIASAWLRLRPRPERVLVLEAELAGAGAAPALGLGAARLASARAAALVLPADSTSPGSASLRAPLAATSPGSEPSRGPALVVELAGAEPVVERDVAWLAAEAGARAAPGAALDRVRRLQREGPDPEALHFRLALRPSRLGPAAARLAAAGAALVAYPGLGLAWASFPARDAPSGARAFAAVAEAVGEAGGSWLLERGPAAARGGRDAFGEGAGILPLTRALKARFDPAGVLNPGRYLGGT